MGAKFKSNKTFSDTNPKTGRPKLPMPFEIVEFIKMPDNEFVPMRLIGPTFSYATHWIEFHSEKQGKKVRFAKPCLGYSHDTEEFDESACPYCKAGMKASVDYISNAIIRDIQDEYVHKPKKWEKSERKTGFKDKASKSKTPVRVVRFTANTAERLKKRSQSNKAKNSEGKVESYPLSDSKHGRDINYLYNSKGTGTGKYELEVQENSKLNSEPVGLHATPARASYTRGLCHKRDFYTLFGCRHLSGSAQDLTAIISVAHNLLHAVGLQKERAFYAFG